jgi:cytosine/adenosine deaminase-related metal-dependent hydrolase
MLSHPPEVRTYTARWVFPVAGPPLPRGTVTVRGEVIEAVEPHGTRTADEDFGNAAIIPGLVNAHTHLDLSGARGLIPPTDPDHFTDWLRGVIAYRRGRTPEQVQADIRVGLAECLRSGTTLIGDIAAEGASWDVVAKSPTRAVVFRELIGLRHDWQDAYFNAHAWLSKRANASTCRKALSPHAPYTVRLLLFAIAVKRCAEEGLPEAIHLAESHGEVDLVEHRAGEFVSFLAEFGFSDMDKLVTAFTDLIQLHPPPVSCVFVHCNYLSPDTAFGPNQSVVYCPRTHAAFGHPPHPFREFLRRGVRVCLGTDSLASSPDLDILAEARFAHARYPDFPGDTLLKMVTLNGAAALGWADEAGSLEPGKSADFVVVPLPDRDTADPYELLFADHPGDRHTLFRGAWRN